MSNSQENDNFYVGYNTAKFHILNEITSSLTEFMKKKPFVGFFFKRIVLSHAYKLIGKITFMTPEDGPNQGRVSVKYANFMPGGSLLIHASKKDAVLRGGPNPFGEVGIKVIVTRVPATETP